MTVAPTRTPAARARRLRRPARAPQSPERSSRSLPGGSRTALVLAGCVALAAVSLALPGEPTYDPMSWIVWGREIAHGALDTARGPSWKPLPVLFTTPFSLAGDGAAPELWLVVARAGGLLGVAMAFRLGARLAGAWAGAIAALAVLASEGFVYHAWRGNSEGLLVGLSLWAVERHLDGRRAQAFALGFAAALLRPELWPIWGLYGLHLAWRPAQPTSRRPMLRRRLLVGALFAAIPLAWFLPEYLGSGDFLRAASRARQPNLDSAAYADFPAFEVLRRSLGMVPLVVAAGAVAAIAAALRRRSGEHDRVVLVLGFCAAALLLGVAAMTQAGFSGNLRYALLPIALVCVLAGAGWVELVRAAGARAGRAAALALAALALGAAAQAVRTEAPRWEGQARAAEQEALGIRDLPLVIERAGGAAALNGCGRVFTTRFQVPVVAWELHRHLAEVDIIALPPGAALAPAATALARDPRFPPVARTKRWVAGSGACPRR